ncbi:hypothetical protein E4U32_003119 [Claviceps aff. humidiphila group G2b]|nr:hypothetical protein E4U32_003119 [Claviceps aff. humidiphila group G2b]
MAFSAHASRARNIGVVNQPSPATKIHVMDPMTSDPPVLSQCIAGYIEACTAQKSGQTAAPILLCNSYEPGKVEKSLQLPHARDRTFEPQDVRLVQIRRNTHVVALARMRSGHRTDGCAHSFVQHNVISEDSDPQFTIQTRLMAAALAQVKHLSDPGDIPQYPINGTARLDWVLHWVEDHTRPGWRMLDLWMQPARSAPVWSDQIEGFPDAETHDELGAGAGCFGPEGYESESLTYGYDMRWRCMRRMRRMSLRRLRLRRSSL